MRVAILGCRGTDTLESNLAETFDHMGHEAHIVDVYQDVPMLMLKKQLRYVLMQARYDFSVRIWKKLCNIVVDLKPDLVIATYREVVPEAVADLKKRLKDVPVVHLNPDAITNLGRQYVLMSSYDAFFTKEPFLANNMKRLYRLNAHYLPESFNPRVHAKPDQPKAEAEAAANVDLVVIANLNPYRVLFVEQLLKTVRRELDVAIYGRPKALPWVGPKLLQFHKGKPLAGPEKAAAFYSARISLNTMHPDEFHGANCRFFEALGSGGFVMTENRPVVKDLATPGEEVVTFEDVQEAAEKLEYYLDHDAERIAVAEAGYRRAMAEHTYEKRIETILTILGGGRV